MLGLVIPSRPRPLGALVLGLAIAGQPRPLPALVLGLAVSRQPQVSVLTGAAFVLGVAVVADSVSCPLFAWSSTAGPPPSPTTLFRTRRTCYVLGCLQEAYPTVQNGFQSKTETESVQLDFRHLCINYAMDNIVLINLLKYLTKNKKFY